MNRYIEGNKKRFCACNSVILSICLMFLASSTALASEGKTFSQGNVDTNKTEWTVKFKGQYDKSSINNNTLYLVKESTGEKVSCTYSYPDGSTIVIKPRTAITAGEKYTVIVTGEIKGKNKKNIKLGVKKSFNVKQALKIAKLGTVGSITVIKGQQPNLPKQVPVIYSDNSTGYVDVTWGSVSTTSIGTKTVTGQIKNSNLKPTIKVEVKNQAHIYDVNMEYYSYLGAYKVKVKASSQVFNVYLNNKKMDYEGSGVYTLTTVLPKGKTATIKAYDSSKVLLDTKDQMIN